MAIISIPNTFTVGAVIVASQHNANFSTIYTDYNGNITDANIAAGAAIADTKLAQVTTAGKVSGAAFTSLTSVPSGAGLIPVANIDTGTTASKILILNGSAQIPAVDGSLLTGITQANLSSILDYGTSASSSTARAQTALKIAYGIVSVGSSSTQAITNLVFTSSSSYSVQLTYATSTAVNENPVITYTSGAAFTIKNDQASTRTIAWLAVGT